MLSVAPGLHQNMINLLVEKVLIQQSVNLSGQPDLIKQ